MQLTVIDPDGVTHTVEDSQRPTVMEVIRDAGLPIAAQCGGSAACATCHVYVDEAWTGRLPSIAAVEEDMLDLAEGRSAVSRLSCQLPWTPALDGLVVRLAPGTEF